MPIAVHRSAAPARSPSPAPAPRSAPLQRLASAEAAPGARPSIAALTGRGGAQALPDHLRTGIEGLAGVSMAGVTVHYNSAQPERVGALAYAQGAAIHLARGQERHLAHEAWHVAQQRQGRVRARGRIDGRPVNDDGHLEREADRMGAAVERMAPAPAGPQAAPLATGQPAMDAHAPIQGVFGWYRHAPPGNIAAQITGLQQTLAQAGGAQHADASWLKAQQDALHATEATVTAWLRNHGAQASETQRQTMAGHLHALEDHHTALVELQLQHNHPLWLPAGTNKNQTKQARKAWREIQAGTGNITVTGTTAAHRNRTLADVAKLLQQRHGRDMIRELNNPNGGNRPVHISDDWSGQFGLAGRPHQAGAWATTFIQDDTANETPAGSGSYVQVDRTNRAAVTGAVGDTGVPLPHFLTLGHELGHALRNRRGEHATLWPGAPPSELDQLLWTEPEEHGNITAHENPLRAEHGLPPRAYHKPPATVRVERGWSALKNRVYQLGDLDIEPWASPYSPGQVGRLPNGAYQLNRDDPTTYGAADAFFARAHKHLTSLERWDRLYGAGRALRRGGAAAWNRVPDRWAGPRAVGALAQGAWNRVPTRQAVAQGGLALAQGVWNRLPALPRLRGG